jgi:ATP-dependent DNA helicase RecG
LQLLRTNLLQERIYKREDRAEAERIWNYPYRALEEAITNSTYHKDYQVREPIEIRVLPDRIEIINQGGPDRSNKLEDVKAGQTNASK